MNVAIVGAGALGRVYGTHLSAAGHATRFVVRPARMGERTPFVVERQNGTGGRLEIASPERVTAVPQDSDLVLLCVRADQLDSNIEHMLQRLGDVPLVALTPLLPLSLARVEGWLGRPLFVGMPAVAAQPDADGVDRFWAFTAAPTRFEHARRAGLGRVTELACALEQAGLGARLAPGVRTENPATTIAFFPLSVAVSRAGGIDALQRDAELTRVATSGAREALALARRIGRVDPPLALLLRALSPRTLRAGLAVLGRTLPEARQFIDAHFGEKLGAQHRYLGAEILELARSHGIPMPGLGRLLA